MVLEDHSFLIPERGSETSPFLVRKHYPAEVVVDGMVLVEAAGVLVDGLESAAQGGEGFGGDGVAVDGCDDVRAGLVDGDVDCVAGWVLAWNVSDGAGGGLGVWRGGTMACIFPSGCTIPSSLTRQRSSGRM